MKALTQQTHIAVYIQDNTGTVAEFLAALTLLLGMLVAFGRFISTILLLASDIAEATGFTLTVWLIGLKALAYGLGVRL